MAFYQSLTVKGASALETFDYYNDIGQILFVCLLEGYVNEMFLTNEEIKTNDKTNIFL